MQAITDFLEISAVVLGKITEQAQVAFHATTYRFEAQFDVETGDLR